jgi:hypothetical protein
MIIVALTVPLLVLLGVLAPAHGARALLVLAWLAGILLLLPRLPRLLRLEQRRTLALAGVGVMALALGLLVLPRFAAQVPISLASSRDDAPLAGWTLAPLDQSQAQEGVFLTFKSQPRISREMFAQLLQQGTGGGGTSPAAPYADELYNIITGYDLDPAVALAFFAQESQFCTTGICASQNMHNWGGNRAAYDSSRAVGTVQARSGPFVSYASWQDGLRDWCDLIVNRYIGQGLDTVEKAVPVYAPAFDGNDPDAYIASVRRRIAIWRGQDPGPLPDTVVHTYANLEDGLLTETFIASGLEYNPGWAFHNYMVSEAQAGRPLGAPLDESRVITIGGDQYAIQTFALDTLYTPLADDPNNTNWSDVRRLSELLRSQGVPPPTPAPIPTATPIPTPTEVPVPPVHTFR